MGTVCCKDSSSKATHEIAETERSDNERNQEAEALDSAEAKKARQRKVLIRKTVEGLDAGMDDEDIAARQGAEDPDLEKLQREAEERQAAKEAAEKAAQEAEENSGKKRVKGRKGTGFVKKGQLPIDDDEDEEEEEEEEEPAPKPKEKSRVKARKGTGFVKKTDVPPDDDEDEEEDAPKQSDSSPSTPVALKKPAGHKNRCKDRKGTGFVKKGMVPIDDEEDDE